MFAIAQEYKALYEEAEADLSITLDKLNEAESDIDRYRQLYEDSKEDINVLQSSVDNLYKLTETQSIMIEELLNKKKFSIMTGLNITPTNLENSGILLGFNFSF